MLSQNTFHVLKQIKQKHFCEPTIWNPYSRASSNVLCLHFETKPPARRWPENPCAPHWGRCLKGGEVLTSSDTLPSFTLMEATEGHRAKASKLPWGYHSAGAAVPAAFAGRVWVTHLCISLDGPLPGLGLDTWLSGTHTWTHRTCHQRHRWVWVESWNSGGCIEDHGRLLETTLGERKKMKWHRGYFCKKNREKPTAYSIGLSLVSKFLINLVIKP